MPEIAWFFGIFFRMFAKPHIQQHRPYFHAYYHDEVAVYAIELITGRLPRRQERLVEAWRNFIKKNCWKIGACSNLAGRHSRLICFNEGI